MERLISINSTNTILLYTVKKKYIFLHFSRKNKKSYYLYIKTTDNGQQTTVLSQSLESFK